MRRLGLGACVLITCWAAAAEAEVRSATREAPPSRRIEAELRLNVLFFDNFFQAPEPLPDKSVLAGGTEAYVSSRPWKNRSLRAFGHASYVRYGGFGPSGGATAGVRSEDRRRPFELAAHYRSGRPSREVGDVLDRADSVGLAAEYGRRVGGDIQLTALGDVGREWYDLAPSKRNHVFGLGGAVRYRGFGSAFSPEVGFRWSRRDVQDEAEDLAQRELFVRLRWVPARGAYLGLRYRRRHRDYAVDDPLARNSGRKDTRQQWTLSADLRPGARRSWR
ncbi:MAG TPA: hypothetical protein VMT87_06285, partial [Vicinamibacteria bacterium]|nr:hypothetical protein [Vicinamibacteria bacterium]